MRTDGIGNKKWLLGQIILLGLIVLLPFRISLHLPLTLRFTGLLVAVVGLMSGVAAIVTLKGNMIPSPTPRSNGKLVSSGIYSVVRHPAYSGIVMLAFGISVYIEDLTRIFVTLCLLIFFGLKSNLEEKQLSKLYPEYDDYKKTVNKKFIPWLY